jgi:hypothetical protein
MLNMHALKAAYEKAIGHETRYGWRKLMRVRFIRNAISRGDFYLSTRCQEGSARGRPRVVGCG